MHLGHGGQGRNEQQRKKATSQRHEERSFDVRRVLLPGMHRDLDELAWHPKINV
jgi:hypothetical protein